MNSNPNNYLHAELTEQIIASAMRVHNEIKHGLNEKIYENGLCIDFAEQGIFFSQQQRYVVNYHGKPCGTLIPDLIVENAVIVDTKVVETFTQADISQMLSYLKITGLSVGLLLNFKHPSLQVKRLASTSTNFSPPNLK